MLRWKTRPQPAYRRVVDSIQRLDAFQAASVFVQFMFKGTSARLALAGVILAFGLGVLLGTFQLVVDFRLQEEKLDELINRVTEGAVLSATRAVQTRDLELSDDVVNGLLAYDAIFDVAILDDQGNLFAHEQQTPPSQNERPWLAGWFWESSKVYSMKLVPAGQDSGSLGQLVFKIDVNTALKPFYQRAIMTFVIGTVRNVILVVLFFIAFYLILARPLSRMSHEFRGIEPGRPGGPRITVPFPNNESDELTQLALSANQMLDTIEHALTKRSEVEQSLRESEEAIRQIINELPAMVGLRHLDGRLEFANHNMAHFFGKDIDSIKGFNVIEGYRALLEAEASKGDSSRVWGRRRQEENEFEGYFTNARGERRYLQGHLKPIVLQGETLTMMVTNDITARKEAEEKMEYMAYHDALTGLPNRLHLVERLNNEVRRARRHGYFGAVLFIDLDHFKNINDSLGHAVGDLVLKKVADRLQASVRDEDLVARLSGDEFVVVLTVLDHELDMAAVKAAEVAEKIRKSLSEPYAYQDSNLYVSCSVGVVVYPDHDSSADELLRFADTAMYQVKDKGRNAVEFFNLDMADKVSRQLRLEGELHVALEEQQLELYFQPKIELATGRIMGGEALLRWNHPHQGLVAPNDFLPVLESSGLMIDVGQWIIEEGCRSLHTMAELGLWRDGMRLSLNISPRQFRGRSFVDNMVRTLESIPVPPNSLELELTESVVIRSVDETIAIMTVLADMGIEFSLDDFGTGYSSISYLKRLPVTSLKIDTSFIQDIADDRSDRVLVETIITMAHLLDLSVVAEGVETQRQLEILTGYGCNAYQGFFYSPAVPLPQFLELLRKDQERLREA